MTTIIACTTPEFVVLASDRAVSYRTQSGVTSPDRMTKTIALYGQFLMGVTGFAELDGLPVDEWVIEALVQEDPSVWPTALANRATRSVGRVRSSSLHKHHTFVAVGFAPSPNSPDEWHPMRFVVSNAHDSTGRLLDRAANSFTAVLRKHPPNKWAALESFGQPIPAGILKSSERALCKYQDHHDGAPQGSVELLARLVSGKSLSTTTVSSACLVSVLPKAAAGSGAVEVPVGTSPYVSSDAITCLNFVGTENQTIAYMPAMVLPGGTAIAKGGFLAPVGEVPPRPFENRPRR